MIALYLITHHGIGSEMVRACRETFAELPIPTHSLDVPATDDTTHALSQARHDIALLNPGEGVVILTDLVGSTPSNIASKLLKPPVIDVITGVNLPMLIRLYNYAHLPTEDLIEKAVSGGKSGIHTLRRQVEAEL